MHYAKRRLKIGNAWREAGEPVPEAPGWTTRRALLANGTLEERDDEPDPDFLAQVLARSYGVVAVPEPAPVTQVPASSLRYDIVEEEPEEPEAQPVLPVTVTIAAPAVPEPAHAHTPNKLQPRKKQHFQRNGR